MTLMKTMIAAAAALACALPASAQTGACCRQAFGENFCQEMPEDTCRTIGGTYLGDGTTCPNAHCPEPPTGACCRPGGGGFDVCEVMRESACFRAEGRYLGDGTTCDGVVCDDTPRGACCTPQFAVQCRITTEVFCADAGGAYLGDGVDCPNGGILCELPTGACCILNEVGEPLRCASISEPECNVWGDRSTYFGDGSTCDQIDCRRPPEGACCTPRSNGACRGPVTELECLHLGGLYAGDGTSCLTIFCPEPPTGACCIPGDVPTCRGPVSPFECDLLGGVYAGDGTTCDTFDCSGAGCACDTDGDGDADVFDLLGFLNTFFAGNADFNGDGATNVFDVLAFLRCFFRGCP